MNAMGETTVKRPMGRPRMNREEVSVRYERGLAGKVRLIAQSKRITMSEYLSDVTRSAVDRDYAKLVKTIGGGK